MAVSQGAKLGAINNADAPGNNRFNTSAPLSVVPSAPIARDHLIKTEVASMNFTSSPTASSSHFSYLPYLSVPESLRVEPPTFAARDAIKRDRELLRFLSGLAERGVTSKTRPRIILYSGTLAVFAQYFIIWDILS
jgi:hypothetical protein